MCSHIHVAISKCQIKNKNKECTTTGRIQSLDNNEKQSYEELNNVVNLLLQALSK
jgi:hypothetical protein